MDWKNKAYVEKVVKDLGYLRQWFEGYAAAGGRPCQFVDALRKAQILIKDKL